MKYACLFLAVFGLYRTDAADLKLGMIGLDTSHVIAFTGLLNKTNSKDYVPGGKVVAAFKGGSPDVESSHSRVDGYTKQLQEQFGVKMVDSIESPHFHPLKVVAQAVRLSRTPHELRRRPPEYGEHTDEILASLGLAPAEIADLRSREIV